MQGMTDTPQDEIIAFLERAETHGTAGPVERIDTHISIIFLAGDHVWKLKRAVTFPYLDYGTVEARRRFCEEELRINRRTAPGLYKSVRAITREEDGSLAIDGAGEALDWVVEMARFDQSALWDAMAARDAITPQMADRLADAIADFHQAAAVINGAAGAAPFAYVIDEENDAEMRRFGPAIFPTEQIAALKERCDAALAQNTALLEARATDGFVRHCHGDMHLGNICQLATGPAPFDAIEFSPRFSEIDVLYDLSFLLMDMAHRGLNGLANRLLNRYLSATRDYDALAAMPLFLSLRAGIRAHVTASRAENLTDATTKQTARGEAASYLSFALDCFDTGGPRLIAIGGLSGTGKTRLARGLAPLLFPLPGAAHLPSDLIRKRLAGIAPEERLTEDWYTPAVTERVHARMFEDAEKALRAGYPAVLDATFMEPKRRARAEAVAKAANAPFTGIWLEAPAAEMERRVATRKGNISDASIDVLNSQRKAGLGEIGWARINTGGGPEETLEKARGLVLSNQGTR